MKTIKNLFAILIVLFLASACHHFGNRIVVNNGKDRVDISYSGEIKFTDDETAIQSISQNGYLNYQKNDKELRVRRNEKGEMKCVMFIDDRKLNPDDPEGKKFMAEAIQEMISVGFDAQGRIARLVKKGGLGAVLTEVDHLDNDFIKSMYLEYLISSDSIHSNEVYEIARKIEKQIGSDFEKGKLLKKFSDRQMKDSLISQAYFEAVKSIGSDFEKTNALKSRISQSLTQEQFNAVITASNTIGSDFEKANLLKELIDHTIFEGESFKNLLSSVSHLGSDFEKANVLKKLAEKDLKTDEQWIGLISEARQVSSEFERSNVLIQIAQRIPKNEEVKASYMNAAKTINAEQEFGRVMKALN